MSIDSIITTKVKCVKCNLEMKLKGKNYYCKNCGVIVRIILTFSDNNWKEFKEVSKNKLKKKLKKNF